MATRPVIQAGAPALAFDLAATVGQKIVRLPTAASRKPENSRYADQRAARRSLKQAQPWPGEYVFPVYREAERRIIELRAMSASPAVNMVRMLLDKAGTDEARRVLGLLKCGTEHGDPFAVEVHDLLEQTMGRTIGDQATAIQALNRLDGVNLKIR